MGDRLIQIVVPVDKERQLGELIERVEGVELGHDRSDSTRLPSVQVPAERVEAILDPVQEQFCTTDGFRVVGVSSPALLHTLAFAIAFSIITVAHLVLGKQAPKIYAIGRPRRTARWCAAPLKGFYALFYAVLMALNTPIAFVLRRVGIGKMSEHETPHNEEESRALLTQTHAHGELTRSEHKVLGAVFEFDESVVRQVMVPRVDVQFFDVNQAYESVIEQVPSVSASAVYAARRTRDTVFMGPNETRGLVLIDRRQPSMFWMTCECDLNCYI